MKDYKVFKFHRLLKQRFNQLKIKHEQNDCPANFSVN